MSKQRVVVIGTGAGGLTASAFLAREGVEVIALERSIHVGGLLNPYARDGYLFNPGVHYIGQCGAGQATDRLLAGLGLSAAELMEEMDPDGFDIYRFPDFEVRVCRGAQAYRDRLAAQFPGDVRGVDNVFEAVTELGSLSRIVEHAHGPGRLRFADILDGLKSAPLLRYINATYGTFLDHAVQDPQLKAVFAASCGDYGLPPARASALIGLGLLDHYINGAYFPRGGSGHLRDAIQGVATAGGASFRTSAEVEHIEVVDGRAVAVRLVGGEHIETDAVVAAIDPRHVFTGLLAPSVVPKKLLKRVRAVTSSNSVLSVNLGVNRDLREIGLGAANIWDYPDIDIDSLLEPCCQGRLPEEFVLFISPNSLKDSGGRMAPQGKTTLEVVTNVPFQLFSAWAGIPPSERGDQYQHLKEQLRDQLLAQLAQRLPGIVEHAEVVDCATPLAMADWVNAIDGGIYGPAQTPEQSMFYRFASTTFLPNLFLAGAGVLGGGILPCMQSGQAASLAAVRALSK